MELSILVFSSDCIKKNRDPKLEAPKTMPPTSKRILKYSLNFLSKTRLYNSPKTRATEKTVEENSKAISFLTKKCWVYFIRESANPVPKKMRMGKNSFRLNMEFCPGLYMHRKTERNAATRPVSFIIVNSSEKKISEYSIGIAIDILLAMVVTPTPES